MATITATPTTAPEHGPTPAQRDALRVLLATRQAERPDRANILSRANAVLLEGRLFLGPTGTEAVVLSLGKDGQVVTYQVSDAACTCPSGTYREGERCKHGEALLLWQDVLATIQAPQAETTESEAPAGVVQLGFERSATIGRLMGALARAQGRMHNPVFDKKNPHFGSPYASLAAIRDAVIPALAAEGIAVTQLPDPTCPEGWVGVTTGLWHASGEYLCSPIRVPVTRQKDRQGNFTEHVTQEFGAAFTYAKRYGLQSVVTVAGDEDDDAESVRSEPQHRQTEQSPVRMRNHAAAEPAVTAEAMELKRAISRALTSLGFGGGTQAEYAAEVLARTGLPFVPEHYAAILSMLAASRASN